MPALPSVRQLDVRTRQGSIRCYVVGSDGSPLIVGHGGTPVTGLQQTAAFLFAGLNGVCHVAFDRPGYGGSDRIEGRRVVDVAEIVRSVLDELGADRASVYGHSGGGPHALATAALLPGRIRRTAVMAGMAPVGREDFDYFDGQTALMRDEMHAALAGPQASRDFWRRLEGGSAGNPWASVLTDADVRIAEQTRSLTESLAEALDAQGTSTRVEDGYVDDIQALAAPWGFELESIAVPVRLFQGTDDLMVPPAHAAWLRDRIPGASLQVLAGHGHILQPFYAEMCAWLSEGGSQ